MMYLVRWEIEISASDPVDAARTARAIQLDRNSLASVFDVYANDDKTDPGPVCVDLDELDSLGAPE